jgi:hypothetical protein
MTTNGAQLAVTPRTTHEPEREWLTNAIDRIAGNGP